MNDQLTLDGAPEPVKTGEVTYAQMMRCPTKILSAEHWIDVPPGGDCACRTNQDAARSNTVLPGLRIGRLLTIQQRYDEWRETEDGRLVFRELCDRAWTLREAGWKHYSHKAIIETIRYDRAIKVGPSGGFKINDHYSSRLVREAIAVWPELDGFFETRELRAG